MKSGKGCAPHPCASGSGRGPLPCSWEVGWWALQNLSWSVWKRNSDASQREGDSWNIGASQILTSSLPQPWSIRFRWRKGQWRWVASSSCLVPKHHGPSRASPQTVWGRCLRRCFKIMGRFPAGIFWGWLWHIDRLLNINKVQIGVCKRCFIQLLKFGF